MLNEYLQFASSRSLEKSENFNLTNLIINIIKKYENKKILELGEAYKKIFSSK